MTLSPGTLVGGRFEILAQAGRGGMASVLRALDKETGGYAAIKMLHVSAEGAGARFSREAAVLAQLRHPGIVGYLAHGETDDGRAYLAMSWVEGETVTARVRRLGKLAAADVMELGASIADALAAAHEVGVVHRDVKPSNVLLVGEGYDHVVLVDFGVARVGDMASPMTHEGMLIGTPGYISPEQARGSLGVDARADQFSLGCVLYACLTGHAPFRGEDLVGVLAKILFQETPRARNERPDIPPELDALVAKAMAKEPGDRFPDAAAMARSLRRALARANPQSNELPSAPSLLGSPTPPTTSGISGREARLCAMVFVGHAAEAATLDDATFVGKRFGGDVERLANGALALRWNEAAGATERALAAARCALALREKLPGAAISLATVRGTNAADDVVLAIDRAAELVRAAPRSRMGAQPVRIDETTAGLLDARFDVRLHDDGLELIQERSPADDARTLLGGAVPCVGRDRELLTLDATLDEVIGEQVARAVLVTADAGVGKSRLRREWVHRIRRRGVDAALWMARADPLDSRAPYGLLGQAARRALAIPDDAAGAAKRERLSQRLAELLPADSAARLMPFLAEVIGAPMPATEEGRLAAARGDRALMAEQIRGAFEEWIVAECARPLVLVLDDAHWSDAATLRLLDAALKAAVDRPLLVAVFARPPIKTAHPKLFAERRLQELRLEELPKRSAERLARSILGPDVAQGVIDRIVALSNGNAFFLEELVRAVAEGKSSLPDSVLSVVEARLEALEPEARRVLRAASVFGQFFWPDAVAAVLGDTDTDAASAWLGSLVQREIVAPRAVSRFGGEPELTFRHVLVRDTAYAMLPAGDKTVAHRAAAAWLEAKGEAEAAVLATHYELAGELGRAARFYLDAANQMLGGGELAAAQDIVARGLSCRPDDATRGELLLVEAEAHRWLGQVEAAARVADEVMRYAAPGSDAHTRAMAAAVMSHMKLGSERLAELRADAMQLLEGAAPSGAVCRLASVLGTSSIFSGDVAAALAVDVIVGRLVAAPSLDLGARAVLHVFRAFLSDAMSDLEAQIQHFDAASTCFHEAGDERNALLHRANGAYARSLVGDYEQAAAHLRAVLELATKRGLTFIVDTVRSDLGSVLERTGDFEQARSHCQLAVEGFHAQGDHRMESASRGYLARALFGLGDKAGALQQIHAALELVQGARQVLPFTLASLAAMELDAGQVEQALAHAEAAHQALRETRSDGGREVFVQLTEARALAAAGREEQAKHALRKAYGRFVARMGLIRSERFRELFPKVEENAALVAWAEREKMA